MYRCWDFPPQWRSYALTRKAPCGTFSNFDSSPKSLHHYSPIEFSLGALDRSEGAKEIQIRAINLDPTKSGDKDAMIYYNVKLLRKLKKFKLQNQ